MTHKPYCAALAVALHAGVLLLFLSNPATGKPAGKPQQPTEVAVLAAGDQPLVAQEGFGLSCRSSYTGIGVRISPLSEEIVEVAPGGPADRVGVRVGDILRNSGFWGSEPGTRVTLQISRDGRELELSAVVGHICYER